MTTDHRTNELQQARIEAAAEYLYDWQTGSVGYFHASNHKELWVHGARQALAAADAHLPTVEMIAEVLSAQTTCDGEPWPSELHRRQARAVLALFGEVAGDE